MLIGCWTSCSPIHHSLHDSVQLLMKPFSPFLVINDYIVSCDKCSQVDPIVASFSGGAVGVISALMVVEINNVKQQEHKRCKYCLGTGMHYYDFSP